MALYCVKLLLYVTIWINQASAVTFTNLDASHSISDQLVAGRHIYTFVTSDDSLTTVTMTSTSSYFKIDPNNDKSLLTKACLSAGSYGLSFLATHTDSSTDTGILTVLVTETAPIMNNLPHTIYVLTSSDWPPTINYLLDIDLGCVTEYRQKCSLTFNQNDLPVEFTGSNFIVNTDTSLESVEPSTTYYITVDCDAENGQTTSGVLTLSVVDTIPTTTTTSTTTPTTTTPTTTTPTTTTTTSTTTTTTTPTTTSTTPTTTSTTPTTTSTTPTTTSTTPTTTTTTPTTTSTTPTTTSTTPTTTTPTTTTTPGTTTLTSTTTTASTTTNAPSAVPVAPQLSSNDESDTGGVFDSAAGVAGVVGGSVAGVGLAAGAGAALWRALGARRRLFNGNDNEAQTSRNNQNNRPTRNLRNITPKQKDPAGRGPLSSRFATETSEPRNKRFNTPSRDSCDSPPSTTSSSRSLIRDFEARDHPPPRTSFYHVYQPDSSYNVARPPITPVEHPSLRAI